MVGRIGYSCRFPGCPELTPKRRSYCYEHRRYGQQGYRQKERGARLALYSTPAWRALSLKRRQEHPICEICGREPSEQTHHVIPARQRPDLALDYDNLQAACRRCHDRERAREANEAK